MGALPQVIGDAMHAITAVYASDEAYQAGLLLAAGLVVTVIGLGLLLRTGQLEAFAMLCTRSLCA